MDEWLFIGEFVAVFYFFPSTMAISSSFQSDRL